MSNLLLKKFHLVARFFFVVTGICFGVPSGFRVISYKVTKCDGFSYVYPTTGTESSFHIIVEELRLEEVEICTGNPLVCGQQQTLG